MSDSGILLLDKGQGLTSARAIEKVKRKLSLKKIGHAGTLDPMATGLLVCLINRATKIASLVGAGQKVYSGTIRLGLVTSTDDITGDVVAESEEIPPFPAIYEAWRSFEGEIGQVPPSISAIKVNGMRSYALVRDKGIIPELKARTIQIASFDLSPVDERELSFRIACSSGTYIRSIARDLGALLGCGGTLSSLRRDASAPFRVEEAKTIEEIQLTDLIPLEEIQKEREGEFVCRP